MKVKTNVCCDNLIYQKTFLSVKKIQVLRENKTD
nr:MAG TPA: hypothetical protein [Caudoviricetes sp.]